MLRILLIASSCFITRRLRNRSLKWLRAHSMPLQKPVWNGLILRAHSCSTFRTTPARLSEVLTSGLIGVLIAVSLVNSSFLWAESATIKIDPARVENHVSPNMYAAFVEIMAEGVRRGITAEMLHDRSFEECPDYLGLPAGWRIEPDERNDNDGAIKFEQTTDEAYPTINLATGAREHSLRVTLARKNIVDSRRGLSQGSISIRARQDYAGYLWVKIPDQKGFSGQITIALEQDMPDGETYSRTSLSVNGANDWRKYVFRLSPTKTDSLAKLSLLFDGVGTLYLDQVSLEPADAQNEVRSDSAQMIAALRPSFIRWPGGNVAQDYHWQWGIGPRDLRPIWINLAWSHAPEPNDLGTDEYLALCERVHAQPSITVNVNGAGATPQEAAAWVEYVNGAATTKYGALRAKNGHRSPYGVRQWEVGNEVFGDWVRGHVDADTYARSVLQYADAMRAVDPNLKLIAVAAGVDWNTTLLKIAGSRIDYLAIHDYTELSENANAANPHAQMMERASEFEASHRQTGELIARLVPTRPIKLIVNEWNLFYPVDVIESMDGAVYASRMMNGFEREGGIVEANCISDLLNGWIGGVIQVSRNRLYGTSQYYAIKLYNDHLGTERLFAEVNSPELAPGIKSVDAVVTRSADKRKVFVKMSNADKQHAVAVAVDLGNFAYRQQVNASVLRASDSAQRNTFAHPDAIIPIEQTLRCSGLCKYSLPAASVVVLTFRK